MEEKPSNEPLVTSEELEFIKEKGGVKHLSITGMLESIRKNNWSIQEDFEHATSNPDNSEHIPAFKAAKFFLSQHADHFRIDKN